MLSYTTKPERLVILRLNPGDDLLAGLRAAVSEHGLRNGLILSGAGAVSRYHVHVVGTTTLPVKDLFMQEDGAYDILSLNGMVLDGRVHAHVTLSDTERAIGGHVEEGCTILTFAVIVLADTPDADLAGWDKTAVL